MKTTNFKAMAILTGLVLVNIQSMNADVVDNVKNVAGNSASSFNMMGLLVIGGIIGASLIVYFISNYTNNEKNESVIGQTGSVKKYGHSRHHHTRHIVKKTS
jgi:hypothetical protein